MIIEYFGTNLDTAGHYFWDLEGSGIHRSRRRFDQMPFNPEGLPYAGKDKRYKDGNVRWYNFSGFTICAIAGSCIDQRPGCKSIFFVEEELSFEIFKEKLLSTPIVNKILDQMPFPILWPEKEDALKLNMPDDGILIKAAILFNNGEMDLEPLTNMVGYASFILNRLKENNDILIPAKNELL